MKAIWIFYIIEILMLALLEPLIVNYEVAGVIAVLVHILFTILVLFTNKKNIREPILIGFLLRSIALFWDLYARDIFILPNSGADTESFYNNAITISNDLSRLGTTRGGPYSDITGLLFYSIGPQRIVGQYLNVLLGVTMIYFVLKTLSLLKINSEITRKTLFFLALYPNAIILSSVFLREIIPTFFVSISIYTFVKWFKSSKVKYMLQSLMFIALASIFHSGVLGVIVGYIFAFLFYQHKIDGFNFRRSTIISFVILLGFFYLSFGVIDELILNKFVGLESLSDLYKVATPGGLGGSAYLKGLEVNNLLTFIIYSPIKSIYFLLSPLPWDWRGVTDIFTFFFDSIFYGGVILNYFKYRKILIKNRDISLIILCMIVGGAFVFGVGVSNAGTAMRHRHKLLPLFIVLQTLMITDRNSSICKLKEYKKQIII